MELLYSFLFLLFLASGARIRGDGGMGMTDDEVPGLRLGAPGKREMPKVRAGRIRGWRPQVSDLEGGRREVLFRRGNAQASGEPSPRAHGFADLPEHSGRRG